MTTYKQLQDYIKTKYQVTVKTCWIAHAKEQLGLPLNLERVQACSEVHIYNWEGNQRIVAPILPEQCYSIDMFGKPKTIIAFDPKAVCFENVDPPRKFGRISAFYE